MTLRWVGPGRVPLAYHCDFVFLPQRLLEKVTAVRIGWSPEPEEPLSDHLPVAVDLTLTADE